MTADEDPCSFDSCSPGLLLPEIYWLVAGYHGLNFSGGPGDRDSLSDPNIVIMSPIPQILRTEQWPEARSLPHTQVPIAIYDVKRGGLGTRR